MPLALTPDPAEYNSNLCLNMQNAALRACTGCAHDTNIPTGPCTVTTADIKANMRDIHTSIVSHHLASRDNNKILRTHPPQVSSTEENLPRHTRRTYIN